MVIMIVIAIHSSLEIMKDVFDFKVDKFNLDDPMQFDDCIKVYGNKKLNSLIGDDDSIFITVI